MSQRTRIKNHLQCYVPFHGERIFSSQHIATLKTSIIFVNDSWPNSEVEAAGDIDLPDALSSLTICFVGRYECKLCLLSGILYQGSLSERKSQMTSINVESVVYQHKIAVLGRALGVCEHECLYIFKTYTTLNLCLTLCKIIIEFLLRRYRIISSSVDFLVNRWQHPCVRSNLYRAEPETNRQSIFGFVSHR